MRCRAAAARRSRPTRSTSDRSSSPADRDRYDGISTAYAPRRTVLDKILVDAADRAGAEVRERFTVEDIVVDDGVVVGIRGHGDGGTSVDRACPGRHRCRRLELAVARAVRPEQYNEKPVLENAFYTYWSGLPVDGFNTLIRGDRGFAAIPTNDDLTLVLVGCPGRAGQRVQSRRRGQLLRGPRPRPGVRRTSRAWPAGSDTSWRWLRSQAAESPEIPVPMTATLRRRLSRMFGKNPVAIPRTNRPGIGLFWPISLSKRSNPSFRSPAGDPNGRTWRFSNHAFRRSITLSVRRTHGRCDDLAVESAQSWYTEAFIRHAR